VPHRAVRAALFGREETGRASLMDLTAHRKRPEEPASEPEEATAGPA
jgi:hypothetical protein